MMDKKLRKLVAETMDKISKLVAGRRIRSLGKKQVVRKMDKKSQDIFINDELITDSINISQQLPIFWLRAFPPGTEVNLLTYLYGYLPY